jgi:hypothetical protein
MIKIFTLNRSGKQWAWGQRDVTGAEGQGVEGARWSGIGVRVGAKSRASGGRELGAASGIWGRGAERGGAEVSSGVEGGEGDAEVGGGGEGGGGSAEVDGAEVGQPDGAKPNFTVIRVSRRRGYSPYTRYIFGID